MAVPISASRSCWRGAGWLLPAHGTMTCLVTPTASAANDTADVAIVARSSHGSSNFKGIKLAGPTTIGVSPSLSGINGGSTTRNLSPFAVSCTTGRHQARHQVRHQARPPVRSATFRNHSAGDLFAVRPSLDALYRFGQRRAGSGKRRAGSGAGSGLFYRVMASAESDPVRQWITTEGGATQVTRISPIGGGCISDASRYDTDIGSFFVKINRNAGPAMFEAEAAGLEAMHKTETIRVPRPYKVGPLPRRGSFIVMEYIQFGAAQKSQAVLGRQLAEMHKKGTSERGFGFHMDNTIGSTPQRNPWTRNWVDFFRDHRLAFQLSLAQQQYNDQDIFTKGQKVLERLPDLFKGVEVQPALLHGDLWSGNISCDADGNPVILDPACYYGHNEAEFGMSWCASFSPAFYNAYFEVVPKQPGFEQRVELYKLYHYLNHYNLFGSGYRGSCMSIIKQFS